MNQGTFLPSAKAIVECIRSLIQTHVSPEPVRAAVAFWGDGAENLVVDGRRFEVICNLRSGGTNPAVVRVLSKKRNVVIRQMDTLHAKVVIADGGSSVSSANFSTNGLALEGERAQTWEEAGAFLHSSTPEYDRTVEWFKQVWGRARTISVTDLERADIAWSRRETTSDAADDELIGASAAAEGLTTLRTVEFSGRAPMTQVYLRSAASLVALGGASGKKMPASAFKFLFTPRAFRHHQTKFEELDGLISLADDFLGYFVATERDDGVEEQPGRLKAFGDGAVEKVAQWMLGEGPRPDELEGTAIEASFSI